MSTLRKQFWKYAREAILSACDAETEKDRHNYLELARTWTQAEPIAIRRSLRSGRLNCRPLSGGAAAETTATAAALCPLVRVEQGTPSCL
jgi:hypothetical protein